MNDEDDPVPRVSRWGDIELADAMKRARGIRQ